MLHVSKISSTGSKTVHVIYGCQLDYFISDDVFGIYVHCFKHYFMGNVLVSFKSQAFTLFLTLAI